MLRAASAVSVSLCGVVIIVVFIERSGWLFTLRSGTRHVPDLSGSGSGNQWNQLGILIKLVGRPRRSPAGKSSGTFEGQRTKNFTGEPIDKLS
jgi:hypothetical protein